MFLDFRIFSNQAISFNIHIVTTEVISIIEIKKKDNIMN